MPDYPVNGRGRDTFLFGTVTQLAPLMVRVDGDLTGTAPALAATPGMVVGSRVMLYPTGTQLVAVGPLTRNAR